MIRLLRKPTAGRRVSILSTKTFERARSAAAWGCGFAALAAVLALQAFSSPSPRPDPSARPGDGRPSGMMDALDGMTRLDQGRLLLAAGQPGRAARVFESLWREGGDAEAPRDALAFYLGLCAERMRDTRSATSWYRKAEALAATGPDSADRRRYLRIARASLVGSGEPALLASRGLPPATNVQGGATLTERDLSDAYEELATSRAKAKDPGDIAGKIRLMSSLLLAGEIVGDRVAGDFGGFPFPRHATAALRFEEGLALLDEVTSKVEEAQSAGDPSPIDKLLKDQPEIAMRYDLVRVRILKVQRKQGVSAVKVGKRLDALQAIVKSYSQATDGMMQAHQSMLLNDDKAADSRSEQVVAGLEAIRKRAEDERDEYLLHPEAAGIQPTDEEKEARRRMSKPYTTLAASQIHVIKGLAALEMRRQEKDDARRAELLASARESAGRSVDEDRDNPIAHYALAMAHEAEALEKMGPDPADSARRKEARDAFEKARSSFAMAAQLAGQAPIPKHVDRDAAGDGPIALAMVGEPPALLFRRAIRRPAPVPSAAPSIVVKEIDDHLRDLSGPSEYLKKAAEMTGQGRPVEALGELRRGMERSASAEDRSAPQLWLAYVDTGLRAGIDPARLRDELDRAGKLFDREDPFLPLAQAKITIAGALDAMARSPGKKLDAAGLKSLRDSLTAEVRRLEAALPLCDKVDGAEAKEAARARYSAYLALALASRSALDDDPDYVPDAADQRAYNLAQGALKPLEQAIARNGPDRLELAEARLAALLAYVHANALVERKYQVYRDEALAAYSSTVDALAELKYQPLNLKLLGSPLLTTIMNRPENKASLGARTEKGLRQAMAFFVDGAISLHLEKPAAAVQQMTEGVNQLRTSPTPSTRGRVLDASELLGATGDGTGPQMGTALEAYRVLSLVEANEPDAALVAALRMLDPRSVPEGPAAEVYKQIKPETIDRILADVPSPLEGFALARALESKAVSLEFNRKDERIALLRQARLAARKTREVFRDSAMRQRFPGFVELQGAVEQRLNDAPHFVEVAAEFRRQSRLADADRTLEDGLRRHPSYSPLWRDRVELAIDRADTSSERDAKVYREALAMLGEWDASASNVGYERHFWEGRVRERLGDWAGARAAYQKAFRLAQADPGLRARIGASLALSRAHVPDASD